MNATINTTNVTFEQISRCHLTIDGKTNEHFYCVENERGDTDDDGSIIEYKVTYNTTTHKFGCTCPAGQEGFAHCHNASGYCKHVVWSVAAAKEDKAERKELHASRVAETRDVMATPEFQAEYAEYLQEQEDIKAGYEHFDSCVPQAR